MPLQLGTGAGYMIAGLIIAGITFLVEKFFEPLGRFGQLLYGVAAVLIIAWVVTLILSVVG